MQLIERFEGRYEVQEVPFGRSYKWCPECIVVECDCGERSIFKMSSFSGSGSVCACGADLTRDIQEKLQGYQTEVGGQLLQDSEATHHPWLYDTRVQKDQHQQDEATYPEDSPWRYNDITSRSSADEREVQ